MLENLIQLSLRWSKYKIKKRDEAFARKGMFEKIDYDRITYDLILKCRYIKSNRSLQAILSSDLTSEVYCHLIKIIAGADISLILLSIPDEMWDDEIVDLAIQNEDTSLLDIPEAFLTDKRVDRILFNNPENIQFIEHPTIKNCNIVINSSVSNLRYIVNKPEGFWELFKNRLLSETNQVYCMKIPAKNLDPEFIKNILCMRQYGDVGSIIQSKFNTYNKKNKS